MNMNGNYKDSLDRLEVPAQNSGNKNQVTPILKNGQKVSYNQNFRLDYNWFSIPYILSSIIYKGALSVTDGEYEAGG